MRSENWFLHVQGKNWAILSKKSNLCILFWSLSELFLGGVLIWDMYVVSRSINHLWQTNFFLKLYFLVYDWAQNFQDTLFPLHCFAAHNTCQIVPSNLQPKFFTFRPFETIQNTENFSDAHFVFFGRYWRWTVPTRLNYLLIVQIIFLLFSGGVFRLPICQCRRQQMALEVWTIVTSRLLTFRCITMFWEFEDQH